MNSEEVAKQVVELVRKQAWYEALELYDDNVVSVEAYSAGGGSPETRGKEGVRGKIDWWVDAMEVHSFDRGRQMAHGHRSCGLPLHRPTSRFCRARLPSRAFRASHHPCCMLPR